MSEAVGRVLRIAPYDAVVHASHETFLYGAPTSGSLRSWARLLELRPLGRQAMVTVGIRSEDVATRALVSEARSSVYVRGEALRLPRRRSPDTRLRRPGDLIEVGGIKVIEERVDADQAQRYAAASGDTNAIHVDEAAARAAGFDGVVLQGMCAFAFAQRAVEAAAGSPVRDIGVRFGRPIRPGDVLRTCVTLGFDEAGSRAARFFVETDAGVALKDGWAALEAARVL
jgi:acyl dehydratase